MRHYPLPELTAIAEALATGLYEPSAVAATYNVPENLIAALLQQPSFRGLVASLRSDIYGKGDTRGRVRRKAAVAAEAALPYLVQLAHDLNVAPNVRLAAFTELAKISGVAPRAGAASPEEAVDKVVVNIHVGDHKTVTIEGKPTHMVAEVD